MAQQNRYGLIKLSSKTNKSLNNIRPSIFDSDDSDSDHKTDKSLDTKYSSALHVKRQQKLDHQNAIKEDSNIFEYDSVYDTFKTNNDSNTDVKSIKEKKPKYIDNLLKHSDERKKEQERRVERKIQKERVKEGDTFADKEQFVTTAYKEKLEEIQFQELKELKEKEIEERLEVTKQKDLSGFYRHLLNETTSTESAIDKNVSETTIKKPLKSTQISQHKARQFRKRHSSEESSHSNDEKKSRTAKTEIDDTAEINQTDSVVKTESITNDSNQLDLDDDHSVTAASPKQLDTDIDDSIVDNTTIDKKLDNSVVDDATKDKKLDKQKLLKLLFTKRTVGEVFNAARERYFERKKLNNL